MLRAVADTHTVIWYIFGDSRLSITARETIAQIAANGEQIAFSSMTLAEIVYLSEKGRISSLTFERLLANVDTTNAVLVDVPFDLTYSPVPSPTKLEQP
ncbi:type II toxin-antitoxin system VapC family toxin [Scytonema sp. NUACC26]|uniref:type II toxin-antitoxin system VapC family toxin n=1 Tax=Scytonema sp. NUACC26 TaxID=3140176 RepID=UPI0034DC2FE8